jgi:eukaryotic-like serine/threonine-protein kinase
LVVRVKRNSRRRIAQLLHPADPLRWTLVDTGEEAAGVERELPRALGPFAIDGLLGEGGSALVYAATWQGLDVALKVPHDERELGERDAEKFLQEARLLAKIRHPAIVEVLDSGRLPDGRPYLLMQRYHGETLAERLARAGAFDLDTALALFQELAEATATLHEAGLLHRDIKPENVYLLGDGASLRLLDFGIAKERDAPASTTTQAGMARGTPATMAPERFFGAAATELTDVYELGVVLYALLVGRLPWSEATNVNARLNPLSPVQAGAAIPEPLSAEIMRALSTRPERRPRSARELLRRVIAAARVSQGRMRVTADTVIADGEAPKSADRHELVSTEPAALGMNRSDGAQVIDSRRSAPPARPSRLPLAAALLLLLVGLPAILVFRGLTRAEPAPEPGAVATVAAPGPSPAPSQAAEVEPPAAAAAASIPKPRPPAAAPKKREPEPPPPAPAPSAAPARGKPKGAPCTRSSECASMLCAAETCQ